MVRSKQIEEIIESLRTCQKENRTSTGIFTILRKSESLKKEIEKETSFLDLSYEEIDFSQRLYHLRENLSSVPACNSCGKSPKKFHRLKNGYFPTCGDTSCKSKVKRESFKKTIDEKYPDGYFSEGSESRNKYKRTMLERYGVDHNFKSEAVRDSIKKTLAQKYGKESPLANPEILKKRNSTCLKNHGTLNFINSEKTKSTNLFFYGHVNPMQNPLISKKVSDSSSVTKINQLRIKLLEFDIELLNYESVRSSFVCRKCNTDFLNHPVTVNSKLRGKIDPCPKCNPPNLSSSFMEEEFFEFVKSIYTGTIKRNDKSICSGDRRFSEIDLYLPSIEIGFEFNGLYWHSELYKDKDYHKDKTEFLLERGIKLYHIWEDDWVYKKEIIKSMVGSVLGQSKIKIHARKCQISYVSQKEYRDFCQSNHLKGYSPASKILGLFYLDELVCLMSFSKTRKLIDSKNTTYSYELIRSCSKKNTLVVGGASKIFNFFVKNIGESLVTYCDSSFSPDPLGTVYHKCGLKLKSSTDPGYYWVIDGKRSNRLNWTKSKLVKMGYPKEKTADQIMTSLGFYKIWDCGNHKFTLAL